MQPRKLSTPTPAELQAYCLGKLDPQRSAEIESYLAGNPDCAVILDSAPDDAVVRHLRGAGDLPTLTSGLTEAETVAPERHGLESASDLGATTGDSSIARADSAGDAAA